MFPESPEFHITKPVSMSTPAAKRRRVDAANATLRKPFQSPLIRRPDAGKGAQGTPEPSKTPDATGSSQEAYSPSSPSLPQTRRPAAPAQQQRFKTPLAAAKRKRPEPAGAEHNHPGAGLLALVAAHGRAAPAVGDLDGRLETARQARRIEEASAPRRPGEPVDQELRELVVRWRGAGRLAAEEVFEVVKGRVERAGGARAWGQMRRRQMRGWRGWDEEEGGRKTVDDGEEEREGVAGELGDGEEVDEDAEEDEVVGAWISSGFTVRLSLTGNRSSTWHKCFEV